MRCPHVRWMRQRTFNNLQNNMKWKQSERMWGNVLRTIHYPKCADALPHWKITSTHSSYVHAFKWFGHTCMSVHCCICNSKKYGVPIILYYVRKSVGSEEPRAKMTMAQMCLCMHLYSNPQNSCKLWKTGKDGRKCSFTVIAYLYIMLPAICTSRERQIFLLP